MKEIELKILNIDRNKIKKSLKKLGATVIMKPTLVKELYFEMPILPDKQRKFSSFRLRSEGKNNYLTIKIKKGDGEDKIYHIREEVQISVSNFKQTKILLELLGFKAFRCREKIREDYKLGEIKIEIDQYPKMKPYIEIEGTNKKSIEQFLDKLGFPIRYTTNDTATQIIRRAGLDPNKLLFEE